MLKGSHISCARLSLLCLPIPPEDPVLFCMSRGNRYVLEAMELFTKINFPLSAPKRQKRTREGTDSLTTEALGKQSSTRGWCRWLVLEIESRIKSALKTDYTVRVQT